MSQGLPVVVGDDLLKGNREHVRQERECYVVALDDERKLTEAVLTLLRDPQLRRLLGDNARQAVQERFSMTTIAARYCEIYQEVLSSSAGARW
jgi:glycosyltransferase involved in cell wall biosynthesis